MTEAGIKAYSDVPQGYILGLVLSNINILYDELLGLPVARGSTIMEYADDGAIVSVAKHLQKLQDDVRRVTSGMAFE